MTTNQIMNLDCREPENQEIIQKVLRQVKPLSKCSDEFIPVEKIERTIKVLCVKYDLFVQSIVPDCHSNENGIIWRAGIFDRKDLSHLGNAYGLTMYECLAKTAIYLYSITRKR